MIDYNQIIFTVIFLCVMYLAVWVVAKTHLWSKIFAALYFIAILPNLIALASGFTFDLLIMAFFNSIYLYILLPIFFAVLLVIRMGEKGWLGSWLAKKTRSPKSRPQFLSFDATPSGDQVEEVLLGYVEELEKHES